jgi:hypothetical protein
MFLLWWCIILTIALVLIMLGYTISAPSLAISGSGLLFLLGAVAMLGSLSIQTGYNEIKSSPCGDNCTLSRTGDLEYLQTSNITYVYTALPEEYVAGIGINHIFGFLMSLIGIFVFIDIMTSIRGLK